MNIITKGESLTVQIIVPSAYQTGMSDIVLSIGDSLIATEADNVFTVSGNVITWQIESRYTRNLVGTFYLVASINFVGLGNRKNQQVDACMIQILDSSNEHSNTAKSSTTNWAINFEINDEVLEATQSIMNVYRGKNALELYQDEKNLPNATRSDMMEFETASKLSSVSFTDRSSITSYNGFRFIKVLQDETNNNELSFYIQDGADLHWLATQKQ
jgi:hypothetical protein